MVTSRIWFTAAQKAELWERWKNGLQLLTPLRWSRHRICTVRAISGEVHHGAGLKSSCSPLPVPEGAPQ